jgi:hypothetical protein
MKTLKIIFAADAGEQARELNVDEEFSTFRKHL